MKYTYFDSAFSLPTGYRFLLKNIIEFIDNIDNYALGTGQSLLDIGCGTMPYKKLFKKYKYMGMDNYAEKQAKPELKGSIYSIPLNSNSIDAVMSVLVLDDVFELDKAISEIARILKNNGYYFAIENQSTHIHNPPYDYFRMTHYSMKKICEKHGLKLMKYSSFGGDFANIGFSFIVICRNIFSILKVDKICRPIYSLIINSIFYPLDRFFRMKLFKGTFEINSLGYVYVFKRERT
jgi:SAM-dependent methyltransferase